MDYDIVEKPIEFPKESPKNKKESPTKNALAGLFGSPNKVSFGQIGTPPSGGLLSQLGQAL